MKDFLLLLWPKLRSAQNSGRSRSERMKALALLVVGLLFWFGVLFVTILVMDYIRGAEVDEVPGFEQVGNLINKVLLSMAFLTFLSVLIFSNLITALSTFFTADDLQLLGALPVNQDSLFFARFAETTATSSWMILLFGLPVFFGYGVVMDAPWYYYLAQPLVIVPFVLAPTGIAVILVIALVNAFPARRLRDILFLLTVIAAALLLMLLRLLQPERLVNPEAQQNVFQYLLALKTPMSEWLPSHWATEVLARLAQGSLDQVGLFLLLLWSTGLALAVLAAFFARHYYPESFSKAQEASRITISRAGPLNRLLHYLASPFSLASRQLILKDIRVFLRDTSQWSQVFLLAALMIIYVFNFRVMPLNRLPLDQFKIQNLVSYLNMGLAGFVLAALAARFVFPMVSLEGRAFWLVKSSPIGLRGFLWSKFVLTLIPLLIIAETLILLTNHYLQVSPFVWWASTITIFGMTFGIVGLGVGLGALFPRFQVDNPAKIATGFGGVLYMIVAMTYILLIVALEAWPTYVVFVLRLRGEPMTDLTLALVVAAFSLVAVVIALAVWLPMRQGLRHLEALEVH